MIAGLSMLSETIYTPTLPDIAKSLEALHSEVESTLSIYLFGFAFGVLFFWYYFRQAWTKAMCNCRSFLICNWFIWMLFI